jgi:hypothetical protein
MGDEPWGRIGMKVSGEGRSMHQRHGAAYRRSDATLLRGRGPESVSRHDARSPLSPRSGDLGLSFFFKKRAGP